MTSSVRRTESALIVVRHVRSQPLAGAEVNDCAQEPLEAAQSRGRSGFARRLWRCGGRSRWTSPVFDDTWALPVVSRGKDGSGAENEAAVSGGVSS